MEKIKNPKEPYVIPIPNSSDILRLLIPACFLFGRQRMDEYDNRKRHSVERDLKDDGIKYLLGYPILLAALFYPGFAQLVAIDGHNRARYSPNHGIRLIPSYVAPLPVVANEVFKLSPTDCELMLTSQVGETLISFNRMPDVKKPKFVEGVTNIHQLAAMFKSF